MIKAVIFDCFGVIVGKGFDYTYTLAGGDPAKDRQFLDDMLRQSNLGIITEPEFCKAMAERLNKSLEQWQADIKRAELADEDLLTYAKDLRGEYKTAVLSNSNKGVLSRKIGEQWLNDGFDEVVCSAEVGMIKPSPDIYILTADKLGVETDECVFIDDHKSFVEAAEGVGMQGIVYKDLDDLKDKLSKLL